MFREIMMSDTKKYAIIKTGGKQYRVAQDETVDIELLDNKDGDIIEFSDVLFYSDGSNSKVGAPIVPKCIVQGEVLGEVTGPKISSVKYKRSHNEWRKFGHRQRYLRV